MSGPGRLVLMWALVLAAADATVVRAHDGPPFPIVSRQEVGPYRVSVWTDPDATDDGSLGGQFWIVFERSDGHAAPPGVRARVAITPLDRAGPPQSGDAEPVDGNPSRQFVALLMDHEGPFAVQVTIAWAHGVDVTDAHVDVIESRVDATYDLRPPPVMLVVYAIPFLLAGGLWTMLLLRRRRLPGRRRLAPRPSA
jgi:hypothetical protein